jgi:hypothetical protein
MDIKKRQKRSRIGVLTPLQAVPAGDAELPALLDTVLPPHHEMRRRRSDRESELAARV